MLNKVYKDDIETTQVENWSILSDNVKYIQHDKEYRTVHDLHIKTTDYTHHKKLYNNLKGEERHTLDMGFGDNSHELKSDYLDLYEGIHTDVVHSNRLDEYSDLSTTYLDRTNMTTEMKVKAENNSQFQDKDMP